MKTTLAKPSYETKSWFIVDAENEILGRLAVRIANILRGRHKPDYTPHLDHGDFVIVTNADKIRLTGKKEIQKKYMFYTGYFGNEKYRGLDHFREKNPAFIIHHAVKGMLPKNKLADKMLTKLKVYGGPEHPHEAQEPRPLPL